LRYTEKRAGLAAGSYTWNKLRAVTHQEYKDFFPLRFSSLIHEVVAILVLKIE
jgi:hypothetical protein